MFRALMERPSPPILTLLALRTLEEEARAARGLPRRTWSARFALAYLGIDAAERWPFDSFWQALSVENDIGRHASLTASLNAIYRSCGQTRD